MTWVDLFVLDLVCTFASCQLMGRNRKWVLEDKIQDAVWEIILRGPRPPLVFYSAQSVNRCQSEEGFEDSVTMCQPKANAPKIVPIQSQRSVRQSPPEAHAAAHGKIQRFGRCRHGREREFGEVSAKCTSSSRGARLRTDHFHAGISRVGTEETGCRFSLLSRAGTRVSGRVKSCGHRREAPLQARLPTPRPSWETVRRVCRKPSARGDHSRSS